MAQEPQTQGETAERAPAGRTAPAATRRTLLVGAGLAGVAGLAAACGGDDGTSGGSGGATGGGETGASGGTGGTGGSGGQALATTEEIPVGGGKVFKDANVVVCQPAQGEFTAFSAECTHKGCPVGSVTDGAIVCPCHDSKFSITDGSVVQPPAEDPLPRRNVTVQGGNITVA
ncbi:Rieske (2Fe-2S) protein [Actinomadura algeriensis]|uniref:Nitrite reductase/ring-hydroxylating ferredoxin subunit n=1 Tax=Actinomadura algeriensis TaxID=1679523 RepID=A0ABR9K0Z0_9ACTN|nr:Rieske (2Fe-2S) protein [Actinomadura algeriensis]MBE1536500.1 nitrite reductase/ring-hydroxylating ferredoxin subunit [Actinomadura algeriensis]